MKLVHDSYTLEILDIMIVLVNETNFILEMLEINIRINMIKAEPPLKGLNYNYGPGIDHW